MLMLLKAGIFCTVKMIKSYLKIIINAPNPVTIRLPFSIRLPLLPSLLVQTSEKSLVRVKS